MYGKFVSVFLLVSGIVYPDCSAVTDDCPLWHIKWNGVCQCGASINEVIFCGGIDTVAVIPGYCMTYPRMLWLTAVFSHVKFLMLASIIALSMLI